MKCIYWKADRNDIIELIKAHEADLAKLADKLGMNSETLTIEFNRNPEQFQKWYTDDTTGIVEEYDSGLVVALNGNTLKHYIVNAQEVLGRLGGIDSCLIIANAYVMMAATVMTEYAVENNPKYKAMAENADESTGNDVITSMYIAARIRMAMPELTKLVTMINDPYIFMSYEDLTEFDWRELMMSVAYYTEVKGGEKKSFWSAMCNKEQGKILQKPNAIDNLVAGLEAKYEKYIA